MDINKRIATLRQQMIARNIDAYIIPTSDPHQSEYVASHWKSREWVSGFDGSSGTVVITKDHAGLWTDSRYFLQAEQQLEGSEMELHKLTIPHTAEHLTWMATSLTEGSKIACDGLLFTPSQIRSMAKTFYEKDFHIDAEVNLLNEVWSDRPKLPNNPIFELQEQYAGEHRLDKLRRIRDIILEKKSYHHIVTMLDDIAWIFNIRSNDVECNPVSIAYAVIGLETAYLFIDAQKVTPSLREVFQSEGILLKPYEEIEAYLNNLDKAILVDPTKISNTLFNAIPTDLVVKGTTISTLMKAKKNEVEIGNIKKAMIKDGVALTKLYRWIDAELEHRGLTEVEVSEQLSAFRKAQGDYHGESFAAIVGYKGNGAIIHYRPHKDTCATIQKEGILLIDSGGQYLQGTTDITRTTALGTPTDEQKRNFTLVLKGHIGLANLHFPKGTRGNQMEILARQHLWKDGLNYGHGTGHGVGYFLNVHEGPQAIGSGITAKAAVPFEVGMFTSNEPGFYKKDEYGIRIENLILTVEDKKTAFGDFLKFDSLTLFPIDLSLVVEPMLTEEETLWLNEYHLKVYDTLAPELNEKEKAWMREQCRAI